MSTLAIAYLAGWWITVFDLPACHKFWKWCVGAAIGCAAWPLLVMLHIAVAVAKWCARNMK